MITRNNYSFQNEGNRRKKNYYTLNLSHPIVAAVVNKEELGVNIIEQKPNLFLKNNGKSTRHLYGSSTLLIDNKQEPSQSITKKGSIVQPPKDEKPNVILKQYEYLVEDIKNYVDNFVKRYYPPENQRVYYARAVWLFRQIFKQYASNRYHRDLYDWSQIYLADKGLHHSGKSAKEISARYGEKVRRYDKYTGNPIFGRKGISKKHIQRKSQIMAEFLQQFYVLMPLFTFMHKIYQNKKEKLIVDNIIDRKHDKNIKKR